MKLIKRDISSKDGSGMIIIKLETSEDLWHAYNLLQLHDLVRCTTLRSVLIRKKSSFFFVFTLDAHSMIIFPL
jgi:stalled ribosome rescue protein Dom34